MSNVGKPRTAAEIQQDWDTNPRWAGITRDYSAEQVAELQGNVIEEHTSLAAAPRSSGRVSPRATTATSTPSVPSPATWPCSRCAGLKAIYLSGWQVAGDANLSGHTYPDQSLYPANSVPSVVQRINNALLRADEIARVEGDTSVDNWVVPIVADGEAGFGGALNVYELQKAMIKAGAAGTHWEDQLASEKKCGHLGGKVLIPPSSTSAP